MNLSISDDRPMTEDGRPGHVWTWAIPISI